MNLKTWITKTLAATLMTAAPLTQAWAEKSTITIAKQTSIAFLPLIIMENDRLIEKHAKAAGLGDIQSRWVTFTGAEVMNSALISGEADIAATGIPGALNIWERTRGTRNEIKGIAPIGMVPLHMITRDPKIRSLKDYGSGDRIASPSLKIAINTILMEMAVEKELGEGQAQKLDSLIVPMPQAEATVGLLSGVDSFKTVISTPPFQYELIAAPNMRKLFSSFDVIGPHSYANALTSSRFREENPKLYGAVIAALLEAEKIIADNPQKAIALWKDVVKSKQPMDQLEAVLAEKGVTWDMTPRGVGAFATFMKKIGLMKVAPNWNDVYFPEIVGSRSGS